MKCSAIARPIPRVPPVTIATRSLSPACCSNPDTLTSTSYVGQPAVVRRRRIVQKTPKSHRHDWLRQLSQRASRSVEGDIDIVLTVRRRKHPSTAVRWSHPVCDQRTEELIQCM